MTEHNQGENPDQNTNKPAMSTSVVASTAPPSVQDKIKRAKPAPVQARLGWLPRTVLALSLLLAVAAAALVGYQFYLFQQEKIQLLADREALNATLQSRAGRLDKPN